MKKKILIAILAAFVLTVTAATLNCSICNGRRTVSQQVDCEYCVGGETSAGYKCAQCNGKGYRYEEMQCKECNGSGKLTKPVPFPD